LGVVVVVDNRNRKETLAQEDYYQHESRPGEASSRILELHSHLTKGLLRLQKLILDLLSFCPQLLEVFPVLLKAESKSRFDQLVLEFVVVE